MDLNGITAAANIMMCSKLGAVILAFPTVRLYDYYQNNVLTMKEENVYDHNPAPTRRRIRKNW